MSQCDIPHLSHESACEVLMDRLGQFRILSKIGQGGMGAVYRARDEHLQRDVAIKLLPAAQFSDAKARARLLREARAAAGLSHPNICVVHEVGEEGGQAYIAMECVDGEPLAERISRGPLSSSEVVRFGIQLADALSHAHDRGIVHRDLKPANIIVTQDQRLKVLDFGLAKRLLDTPDPDAATDVLVTAQGVISGTPAYISPEQLRGFPADARSDIWALGVILYEMRVGKRPFLGNTMPELSAAILSSGPIPFPPQTTPELAAIIGRCLEKEPANRFQTAAQLRSALEVMQSTAGISPPALPSHQRSRWVIIAAAAAAVMLAVALAVILARSSRARNNAQSQTASKSAVNPAAAPESTQHALAVLPFSNYSSAEEQYLADGMQDAVIGELARVKELRVISRTSTLPFKKSTKSAMEIAKVLNADHLLEGSVARAGDRVRVQVKLIKTVPAEHEVWSEAYDRDMSDVLTMYGNIAGAVAAQVDSRLVTLSSQSRSARKVDPEIYNLYARGRFELGKETPESFAKALSLFKQANDKNPSDPLPYAGIAIAYAVFAHTGVAAADVLEIGNAAAHKAIALDPNCAEAYAALAMLKQYYTWEWSGREQDFRTALELNPSDAATRRHYAWFLMLQKRGEEALAQMRRARDDDPLTGTYYADTGWILQMLGRYDEALSDARRGVALAPDSDNNLLVLGLIYDKKHMFKEALEAHRKLENNPFFRWGLGYTLIVAGHEAEANALMQKMKSKGDAFGLVPMYVARGDKEQAFRYLEQARLKHHVWTPWVGVFAEWAPLRSDPRFARFLASVGVPNVEPEFGQPKR